MSDELLEAKQEIKRLRELVRFSDQKHKRRTARVEIIAGENDADATNGMAKLRMVVTCPSTVDEMEFGKFVASAMSMIVRGASEPFKKFEVSRVDEIFPEDAV